MKEIPLVGRAAGRLTRSGRAAMVLFLTLLCTNSAWAEWTGSGTQADPYQIGTVDDWNALATNVENGQSYSGTYFKLTNNIDRVETMVGSSKDKAFAGHFYGNGKTLTVSYVPSEPYAAPFRYIDGATITNLTVDGIIWTSAQFAGGLVAVANGDNVIADCRISVAMNSEVNGEGSHGGVVAIIDGGTTAIDNCLFDYWLLGSETTKCGGFVGWCNTNAGASVMLTNCLFNPAQVTMSGSGSKAFVRYNGVNLVKMDRCYYTDHTFGLGQGESRKGFSTASILSDLGDGWKIENEKVVPAMSGTNIACAYVTGMKFRYQYTGEAIDIAYTVMAADGKELTKGTDYTAEITHNTVPVTSVTDKGYYKLTLTGKDPYSGTKTLTFNVENPTNLASVTGDYVIQNGEIVTGKLGSKVQISIADDATVTLSGITIEGEDNEAYSWAGLTCLGNATIVLADGTENTVGKFYQYFPGIFIPENKTLTIEGSGTLNVSTSDIHSDKEGAAGIGGHKSANSGNIVIKGGIINAKANAWAPGIGCGHGKSGGYIRIEGGVVNATGGMSCGGIGSGYLGTNGPVTITKDAMVTAIAGDHGPYSIGKGTDSWTGKSQCGTVTIGCTLDSNGNPVGGHVGGVKASPFTYFHYTAKLDADGTGNMTTEGVDRGFDSNKTLSDNLTREGYTFMGWVAENGGTLTFYPGGTKYSDLDVDPGATITLTAQWMKGSGTAEVPYEIASDGNWLTLAHYINDGGGSYNNKYYKLMDNISISETVNKGETPVRMIGTSETNAFSGTFDGNGYTLTLDITDERDEHYCGPFRFINGATIENLHVTGTIVKTKKKHVGGIAGKAYGTNTITNCRSSVDIQANTDGDGSHGGFIGDLRGGETTLTGCTFDGKMRGPGGARSRTMKWGGFIGWVAKGKKAILNTCVFAPTEISLKDKKDSRTFARRENGDDVTLTTCYYTQPLGSAQGKQAYSISGDEHVSVAFSTVAETRYSVSGIDSYENGAFITCNGVMYSIGDKDVSLNLSQIGGTPTGYTEGFFIATPGSQLNKPEQSDYYLLNMPNHNVTIGLLPEEWAGSGVEYNPYLIYNEGQWNRLAERVNHGISTYSGEFFKLMADITVTETVSEGNAIKMVGWSDDSCFRGTFDGDGHTITVNYTDNTSAEYCAPFRFINGATIKNLNVSGTITKANGKNAGGLVGKAVGTNTITACRSSVDILLNTEGDVSSGGFIGELRGGGTTSMINCLFDGKLRGTNAYKWGGFVGWVASGNTVTLTNCLFAPAATDFDINDSNDNSKTFARHDGTATLTNCYYKTLIKDAQGATNATEYSNELLLEKLGDGWQIKSNELVPIMGIYGFDGEGTQGSPYIIASAGDWNGLATNVAQGELYEGKYFQLATNITVSSMIGSTEWLPFPFKGNFDGAGNKLTFTPTATNYYIAPFRFVDGATVENLHVCGTINTLGSYAAGLISYVKGTTTIRNCRSSVTINITGSSSQHNGGFIAYSPNGKIIMTGCLFDGSMQFFSESESAYDYCGGFIGTTLGSVQFNDCLFAPAAITNSYSDCGTFTYFQGDEDDLGINNCYYTQTLGEAQGKQARSITADTGITIEGGGTVTEYDVSGITGFLEGIMYNGVLYAGYEDEVRLNLDYEQSGYTATGYTASAGTLSATENFYKFTMPDQNVTISVTTEKNTLELFNAADNSENILNAAASGKVYDVTLANRKLFHDTNWNTLCLPFDVTVFEGSPLENAIVKELDTENLYTDAGAIDNEQGTLQTGFDSKNGTLYLYFKDATSIEAGKPYIVKWVTADANAGQNPTFEGVRLADFSDSKGSTAAEKAASFLYTNSAMSEDGKLSFIGTYAPVAIGSGGDKTKLYLGSGNTLYYPNAAMNINTCRAYFQLNLDDDPDDAPGAGGQYVRAFVLNFGDDSEETGIVSLSEEGREGVADGWYTLSGVRLAGKPTVRGLFIHNGRKVAIQ